MKELLVIILSLIVFLLVFSNWDSIKEFIINLIK